MANDTKSVDIRVLNVQKLVFWTRYFVLATCFSKPQARAHWTISVRCSCRTDLLLSTILRAAGVARCRTCTDWILTLRGGAAIRDEFIRAQVNAAIGRMEEAAEKKFGRVLKKSPEASSWVCLDFGCDAERPRHPPPTAAPQPSRRQPAALRILRAAAAASSPVRNCRDAG